MAFTLRQACFFEEGSISGVKALQRAGSYVDQRTAASRTGRFQLRAKDPKFLKTVTWSWEDNPFLRKRASSAASRSS